MPKYYDSASRMFVNVNDRNQITSVETFDPSTYLSVEGDTNAAAIRVTINGVAFATAPDCVFANQRIARGR